jgi:hypothetical protein
VTIRVNGVEYDSWDAVPEEIRRIVGALLPDDDHDGTPDAVEGALPPGHYGGRIRVTRRTKVTEVRPKGDRPGFRFAMTDESAQAVPPHLGDDGRVDDPVETSGPPTAARPPADGPIILNGVEVGADGRPLKCKRWWQRG